VMGMAVFAGMLIATILGVCLIPMLFVAVQRVIGAAPGAAHGPAMPPVAPEHGSH